MLVVVQALNCITLKSEHQPTPFSSSRRVCGKPMSSHCAGHKFRWQEDQNFRQSCLHCQQVIRPLGSFFLFNRQSNLCSYVFLPPCRVIALWACAAERGICGFLKWFSCTDSFWCSAHKPKEFSINYENTRAKINSNSRLSLTPVNISWNKQLLMHSWSSDNTKAGFPVILKY